MKEFKIITLRNLQVNTFKLKKISFLLSLIKITNTKALLIKIQKN